MKDPRKAEVIETTRSPPLWSVKAGGRFKAAFMGPKAKAKAVKYAAKSYDGFVLVEKPALTRPMGKPRGKPRTPRAK